MDLAAGVTSSPPPSRLSRRAEQALRPRQVEVLDRLEALVLDRGFAAFTVGELAAELSCSRRTLYELAPSKDDLVLLVLDRFLHRVGRAARDAVDPAAPAPEQIRSYILHGAVDLARQTAVLYDDIDEFRPAARLLAAHYRFVTAVTEHLVRAGIRGGELAEVNPRVIAVLICGRDFTFGRPELAAALDLTPTEATEHALDVVLRGLRPS